MLSEGSRAGVCPNYRLRDYNTIQTFPLLYCRIRMNDTTDTIFSFLKLSVFLNPGYGSMNTFFINNFFLISPFSRKEGK